MIKSRKQSTTDYPITFLMVDSADHVTGKTGLTPTVTISKNGGAFGAASGAVSEIANGWYKLAGHAGDRDTLGELLIHASASGADPADLQYCIVEYDPFGFAGDIVGADGDTLESLSDQLDTAQADLDNPSQYMADVSGLATAANLATVDGVVDAIKAKTDLLPADPAGVSDVPTSEDIADAVWDELLSGHVVAGSAGEALAASGASSDPLLNQVPGSYASGTAGAALGRIGSGQITTVSPVAQDGDVTTIRGDDYDNAHGRALDWTDSEAAWPDLTGATIEVIIGGIVELAGSVVTPSGSGKKVRLELTDVQTAAIRSGVHAFQVIATLADGDIVTLVEGNWTSKRRLAA